MDIEIERRFVGAQAVNQVYVDTARLLTQVAPLVFADNVFALKGGTAINLFVRDMPRLSVDLDLVFIDHRLDRKDALVRINESIRSSVDRLTKHGFKTHAPKSAETEETKLFVRRDNLEVKVEVNFVHRGTLHPTSTTSLTPRAKETLLADLELSVLAVEELYGGKLVAAMDRQHPRDLFDVMQLFEHGGITPAIRRSFVAYLACHNRPIHEVLFPTNKEISAEYERTFRGMTVEPVELEALLAARERMARELQTGLDANERDFLLSIARNEPNYALLGIEHLEELPGIRWKLMNLEKLAKGNRKKFEVQARELERLIK